MTATDTWPLPPISDAGSIAYWEWWRVTPCQNGDDVSHTVRIKQAVRAVRWIMSIIGCPDDGDGAALLDVSAGLGYFGKLLKEELPKITVHQTEQSPELVRFLRLGGIEGSPCAVWSTEWGDADTLYETLGRSTTEDRFYEQYDVVTATFVADCVRDPYRLLDNCWAMVRPGGALVVAVQRNFEQRVHLTQMDWDKLLGMLSQYGLPQITFEDGNGQALVAARLKGATA